LTQVATGNTLDKLEGKEIFRANSLDLFKGRRVGIKYCRQTPELLKSCPGRLFAVRPGSAEGLQQLNNFGIGQRLNAQLQEFFPQALPLPSPFFLPLFFVHDGK
jgi:hypothetical protein